MSGPPEWAGKSTGEEKAHPATKGSELPTDPFLVHFDFPHDPSNPRDWSLGRKWIVTSVLSVTGLIRITVSTIMAPALPQISKDLNMNSVESLMALSVYLLATAFGPLLIGPLSEMYGRSPILHSTNIWFLIWNLVCGFANTKGTLIASRLLAGLGASAIYSLGNGVLGDIWPPEQRGRSIGLYMLIPLLGAAIGPIVGGIIAGRTSWRWIFWETSIVQAFAVVFCLVAFRETHTQTILNEKAKALCRSTGDDRYHARLSDLERQQTFWSALGMHLTRPFRLLIFHPIVQIQAMVSGYNYGLLYLILATYSSFWTDHYHETVSYSGLHYLSVCVGEITGSQIGGFLMDFASKALRKKHSATSQDSGAEYHIPLMAPAYLLTAVGLLLGGWSAQHLLPWPVVDVGFLIASFGNTIAGQVITAYVIDAYPNHVASASAGAQLIRSLTAFGFPLFAPAMFRKLGYGWSYTILDASGLLIGLPATAALWWHGARLRKKAAGSY
ncbi:putative transporter [Cyphellophora attinorum]|uniref:Putative transporter n=1 Tax=Cyphellophora attinorum TaxID=1664694 RepID=A0A0N1NYR0_9EURO|nr:putative transporter [Phialophora attinorum]KPI37157.1 putative transporter [Phialophora attinorum]